MRQPQSLQERFFWREEAAVHLIMKQATSNNIFDRHLDFENCGIPTWLDWTQGTGDQTLTSFHVGHVHLWINRESPSVHVTPSGIGRSDRTWKDFKVGISNEDKRNRTTQNSQSDSNPNAGRWLARFFFNHFICQHVSIEVKSINTLTATMCGFVLKCLLFSWYPCNV